ncbi:MAG: hypothetical protein FJ403_17025 [Verrucomicrobia bacterium]|nr:hypothetical protein [Verrucomicrobiota bacterium]
MTLSISKAWLISIQCCATVSMLGADWTSPKHFRSDAGISQTVTGPLPQKFDSEEALCWRKPIDPGHSTPILHRGIMYLTTYREAERELATLALDQNTGEVRWKQVAPTTRIEPYHQVGSPAAPTPACDGERLYVFFGSCGLICYDLEGKKLWDHRMEPFQDEFGAGSSPILADGKIIISQDHDIDSFVMAIDRSTGKTIWQTSRPAAVRSYSTPTVWPHNGRKQILVAGALELASYDLETGEKLWWVNGLARIVIPIPVASGDTIYMASWSPGADAGTRIALESWEQALAKWDKDKDGKLAKAEIDNREVLSRYYRMDLDQNEKLDRTEWDRHSEIFRLAQNAILALKPNGRGDLTSSSLVWKYQRGIPYVSTPLLDKGILWMVKDGGIVTKLEAASGRVLQEERIPGFGSYYASPVTGDGKVYFASEQGAVTVVANQQEWNVLSSREFKEKIYATPVIDRDRIYIRTEKALYCFKGGAANK